MTTHKPLQLISLGVLFACSGGAPATPAATPDSITTAFHLTSAPTTYRLTSNRHNTTVVQGQSTNVDSFLELSVQVEPGEANLVVNIDSVHRVGGQVFDLLGREDVTGAAVMLPRDSRGRLGEPAVQPPEHQSSPVVGQVAAVFAQFYPRLPATGVSPGASWSDSTALQREQQGADILIEAFTEFTAQRWSDTTTTARMTVQWTRHYTISGAGEQMGQSFTIDGTGRSTGAHEFSMDGRHLRTVVNDSSSSQLMVTSLGISLPVIQMGTDTIMSINR